MIYFVKDTVTQAIKIGRSKKPKGRLSELQTGNPHKLVILGTVAGAANEEASFHGKFVQHRLEGEWFKGEIIEEVLDIIATHTRQRLEIRRKTVTDVTNGADKTDGDPLPDATVNDKGALDADSGVQGVCRIPGLRMKSLSLTLTERPHESAKYLTICGVQIKYLLVFEKDFTQDDAGRADLAKLRSANIHTQGGLKHTFYDEDNAVIPFYPPQPAACCHIVGGMEAITGAEGDAFRVLVSFERPLNPNAHQGFPKEVFTGDNYTGEHPLKQAKKIVVSLR